MAVAPLEDQYLASPCAIVTAHLTLLPYSDRIEFGSKADAALRLVHAHWRAKRQDDIADLLAYYAWAAGCRDTEIVEAHALALAASGRNSDLEDAIAVCETTLAEQNGSTDEAWRSLAIRLAQLSGRLRRLDGLPSGRFDSDGNPIPKRRHHPARPRRSRPPRFVRPK